MTTFIPYGRGMYDLESFVFVLIFLHTYKCTCTIEAGHFIKVPDV